MMLRRVDQKDRELDLKEGALMLEAAKDGQDLNLETRRVEGELENMKRERAERE